MTENPYLLTVSRIYHSGTPHEGDIPHSGRYPYGSGANPMQHPKEFMDIVRKMESEGLTLKQQADKLGLTVKQLQNEKSVASGRVREANRLRALELKAQGMGATDIAREMGLGPKGESTVRNWLAADTNKKHKVALATADVLRMNVDEHRYIDVGKGVAEGMGIPSTRLSAAITILEQEGYILKDIRLPNPLNPAQQTPMKVLVRPDVTNEELYSNKDRIWIINAQYANPSDLNPLGLKPIQSISSDKVQIVYGDEGGKDKDGVIELRRGAEGLDMGSSMYAQVRIGVDDKYFLKGMAVYSDNLPDGIDIRFNTNKDRGTPIEKVFKPMKDDPNNPFGSSIKLLKDDAGNVIGTRQSGYLNIVNEEGDWSLWSKTLASQMLSKQPVPLARRQLALAEAEKRQEYEEIMSLTNPTVKRYLLEQYADSCDTAARHLKAAAMPKQGSHVILPIPSLKPNEVYAPNYDNGTRVVLIRYPHGGKFEIPELVVNNHNDEAESIFVNPKTGLKAPDAIGIHPSVASRLSGADFDGDTVLVIPNPKGAIKTAPALAGLKDFDPHERYPKYTGMPVITKEHMQRQMGEVTNLINDMTLKGAPSDDICRAVRYSMVIIDAKKHELNYKQAYDDNDIEGLKRKWQKKDIPTPSGKDYGGASTLISRAKSSQWVQLRKQGRSGYYYDPETGEKIYRMEPDSKRFYTKKVKDKVTGEWVDTGKVIERRTKSTQMDEAKDARILSSGTDMEEVYANYANNMKALANQARKSYMATKPTPYSSEAHKQYLSEAESIKAQVDEAKAKLPLERKAKALAAKTVKERVEDQTGLPYRAGVDVMDKEELKKIRSQALVGARAKLGSKKPTVIISDREWEAIQKGAVSNTTFMEALRFTDQDALKARAMPKQRKALTSVQKSLIKQRLAVGYTQAEVAKMMGLSATTIGRVAKES